MISLKSIVPAQSVNELFSVGELGDLAAAVNQDHLVIALVDLRVFDQAGKRREPGSGREQEQPAPRQQVVNDKRAGRLATDQDDVALADLLQSRGQWPVGHLDTEELERFLMVCARHAIGAQQRAALDLEAHHGELAAAKAEGAIARGGEAEQRVGPMPNAENLFFVESGHARMLSKVAGGCGLSKPMRTPT